MITLRDYETALFNYFKNNGAFDLDDGVENLKCSGFISDNTNEEDKFIFKIALERLAKIELITKINEQRYILTKPLTQYSSKIELDGVVSMEIANVLNDQYRQREIDKHSDPLNIEQEDIIDLLKLAIEYNRIYKKYNDEKESDEAESLLS